MLGSLLGRLAGLSMPKDSVVEMSTHRVPSDELSSEDEDVALMASDSDDDILSDGSDPYGAPVWTPMDISGAEDSDEEDEIDEQLSQQQDEPADSSGLPGTTGQVSRRRSHFPAAGNAIAGELLRRREILQEAQGVPVDFLAKVAGMLLLRRFNGQAFRGVELMALVLPVPCRFLPGRPAKAIGALARSMVKAVLTTRALAVADVLLDKLMRRFKRCRGRRGHRAQAPSSSQQAEANTASTAASAQGPVKDPAGQEAYGEPYMIRAAVVASMHKQEMSEMEMLLRQRRVVLPEDRFSSTNAELCRFAASRGLLEGKADSVQKGADMVAAMVKWRQGYRFMNMQELSKWGNLVRINGADSSGRPVLVVLLGQALSRMPKKLGPTFVRAIISNMEYAVTELLGDTGEVSEHIVTVVDVSGCNIMHASGAISLLKEVTNVLSQNYPARLACLYVVDLPRVLKWALQALFPFMHPVTRQKLRFKQHDDPELPVRLETFKAGTLTAIDGVMEVSRGDGVVPSRASAETQRDLPPLGLPPLHRPASSRSIDGVAPNGTGAGGIPAAPKKKKRVRLLPREPSVPSRSEKLTGRMLDFSDLTTLLYLLIAIAVCTVLTQQTGIAPRLLKWLQQQGFTPLL